MPGRSTSRRPSRSCAELDGARPTVEGAFRGSSRARYHGAFAAPRQCCPASLWSKESRADAPYRSRRAAARRSMDASAPASGANQSAAKTPPRGRTLSRAEASAGGYLVTATAGRSAAAASLPVGAKGPIPARSVVALASPDAKRTMQCAITASHSVRVKTSSSLAATATMGPERQATIALEDGAPTEAVLRPEPVASTTHNSGTGVARSAASPVKRLRIRGSSSSLAGRAPAARNAAGPRERPKETSPPAPAVAATTASAKLCEARRRAITKTMEAGTAYAEAALRAPLGTGPHSPSDRTC